VFYLFGLENYGTVLSTRAMMQNPQLKYMAISYSCESMMKYRAWKLDKGPLILKICKQEYYSAVKLRELFTGKKLNEMHLVDVEPWSGSRGFRHGSSIASFSWYDCGVL
jgi:hypothetical protein